MCLSMAEADSMIAACADAGVLLMYAEELCFAPKYMRLKSLLGRRCPRAPNPHQAIEKHDGPHAPHFWDVERAGGGVLAGHGLPRHRLRPVDAEPGADRLGLRPAVDPGTRRQGLGARTTRCSSSNSRATASSSTRPAGPSPGGMDDRAEVHGSEGVAYADLLHGNSIETYSSGGLRLRGGEGRRDPGLELHHLRGGVELRLLGRVRPLRGLRAERHGTAGDRERTRAPCRRCCSRPTSPPAPAPRSHCRSRPTLQALGSLAGRRGLSRCVSPSSAIGKRLIGRLRKSSGKRPPRSPTS